MKLSLIKYTILLAIPLTLLSCQKHPPCPEQSKDIDYPKAEQSSELLVDTYVNSSRYLKGFVDSSDKYNDLVDKISNLPIQIYSKTGHNFFKFNKDGIVKADNKKFLDSGNYSGESLAIENIISSPNFKKERLNVIVTDFSQKMLDPNFNLVNNLISSYITKGLSVGLVSLKLPFKGIVNPDGNSQSYNYNGGRNVFVMILGKYGDVKKYFLEMKSNESLHLNYSDLTIFSHHIIYHKIDFDRIPKANFKLISIPENSIEESDQIVECEKNDPRVKQFILSDENSSLQIEKTLEFEKFEYTPDFKNLKAEISFERFDSVDNKFVDVEAKFKQYVHVAGYQIKNNPKSKADLFTSELDTKNIRVKSIPAKSIPLSAKINININTKELNSNIYRLKLKLYPSNLNSFGNAINEKNYTYNTVSNYNRLSISEVEKRKCLTNSTNTKCGLTPNLSNFIDSILNSMEYKENKKSGKQLFNDKKLNVAEFYYYIKKP
ncbi:MAG: hypothetical protein H7263_06315 [Candidatus Sericytochromatia bacterium]|nr:hypothetical protein [Candidatus Sericytochromatia bacterium]